MHGRRTWVHGLGALLGLMQGCYNAGPVCEHGVDVVCEGEDGCVGVQRCGEDGVLAACVCEADGSIGATTAAPGTSSGTPGSSTTTGAAGPTTGDETSGGSTEPPLTGSGGPGDDRCDEMCPACGAFDCGGKYHDCGGCEGEEVCVDNVCVPPCKDREVLLFNAGILPPGCNANIWKVDMVMTITSSDFAIDLELSEGAHQVVTLPHGEYGEIEFGCTRKASDICPSGNWKPCAGDPMKSCQVTGPEVREIKPDDCTPQVIEGCN